MRKRFLKAAIFISVLLLIFQGFLMYRDNASYNGVIHQNADKIIKIRVDAIGKSMFYNALKHPAYYYHNLKKERDTIDEKTPGKGFYLPANIFLYTIKGKEESTVFSSFGISDVERFKAYLKGEGFSDFKSLSTFQIASKSKGKLAIAYSEKQCVVVYNPSHENVNDIFMDLLQKNNTLQKSQDVYKKLKDADEHINYMALTDHLDINFKDGKVVFSGNIALASEFEVPTESYFPRFSEGSSLKFFLNLNTSRHFEATTIQEVRIAPDSILKYYKGNLMIELAGATQQQDSIVTYEYNDNFEKVEVKTASIKKVPEINLVVSTVTKDLLNYLQNASIIRDDKLNPKLFPLYQFKVDTTTRNFQLSTHFSKTIEKAQVSYNDVFGLEIDFIKLKEQNHFPIMEDYLNMSTILKLKGTLHNSNIIAVEGHLELKVKDINVMAQLIF